MKLRYNNKVLFLGIIFLGILNSCKKDWLDAKPSKSLVIPTTIADYQAILDNASSTTDYGFNVDQPSLDEISAGDFYMTDANWNSREPFERNTYVWASGGLYGGSTLVLDWNGPYKKIFNANVVLEGIEKITAENGNDQISKNDVKGAALFFRAYEHYSVAQLFCKPFSTSTANTDLGIPLRLTSDFSAGSIRSTVRETYDQIISDLKQAKVLLPVELPNTLVYKNRPTKAATDAMLARVYLAMSNYDSAFKYANNCLQKHNLLMDYNNNPPVNPSSLTPFQRFNDEVIFQKLLIFYSEFAASRLIADTTLYNSYDANDLRKTCFFRLRQGVYTYKGSYDPSFVPFSGLATDEIYLIRAECNARLGNTVAALQDLNTLLITRWKTGTFVPFTAADANDALRKVLVERKKELCFRGIRWSDLRRLNMDPQFAITLTRKVNNQTYTLPPNDQRYVLPIPDYVIQLSGIQQNPR